MNAPSLRCTEVAFCASAIAICLLVGCGKGQSSKSKMEFSKLSPEQEHRLSKQRELVLTTARARYGTVQLTTTRDDLTVLQRLVDDRVFKKEETYELQSLGVAFGDVLATELGLHWELVTDDYGTDPVLRAGTGQVQVAALTMISKRVEDGKPVDLNELLEGVRDTLKEIKKEAGKNN